MENQNDKIPGYIKSAAGGAAIALVMALFTPVTVLLGLEAAIASGVCIYNWSNKKKQKASDAVVDVTPEEEKRKEN